MTSQSENYFIKMLPKTIPHLLLVEQRKKMYINKGSYYATKKLSAARVLFNLLQYTSYLYSILVENCPEIRKLMLPFLFTVNELFDR